jgi:hypothetical protein
MGTQLSPYRSLILGLVPSINLFFDHFSEKSGKLSKNDILMDRDSCTSRKCMRAEFRNLPFSFFATFPKMQFLRIWHPGNSCPVGRPQSFRPLHHFLWTRADRIIKILRTSQNCQKVRKSAKILFGQFADGHVSGRCRNLHSAGKSKIPKVDVTGFVFSGGPNLHFVDVRNVFFGQKCLKNGIFGYTSKAD